MEKRKTRRLGAIAVMLSLIGLIAPMLGSVYAADALSTKLYWGYRVESTSNTMVWPLYVLDDGDIETIAYCFNAQDAWPVTAPRIDGVNAFDDKTRMDLWDQNGFRYYKITGASESAFEYYSASGRSNLKSSVLKVVYNGYPYYASGIQTTYRLTDMQMRAVTQAAIWYYTDGQSLATAAKHVTTSTSKGQLFTWTTNMTNAYNLLISNSSLLETPPSSFELDLFIAQNQLGTYTYRMQNLLSVRRVAGNTGVIQKEKTGTLEVSKKVTGNMGDKNADFTIKVSLDCTELKTSASTIKYTDDGVVNAISPAEFVGRKISREIRLKDGEKVSFSGIPYDAEYSVSEDDYTNTGYDSPVYDGTDEGADGTMNSETEKVEITNHKDVVIDTGINDHMERDIVMLIIAITGLALIIFERQRKSHL